MSGAGKKMVMELDFKGDGAVDFDSCRFVTMRINGGPVVREGVIQKMEITTTTHEEGGRLVFNVDSKISVVLFPAQKEDLTLCRSYELFEYGADEGFGRVRIFRRG